MRWAVTGTGMVTSVGGDKDSSFRALCNGVSGVKPLQAFDLTRFNAKHAYEITDRNADMGDKKVRASKWLCTAVNEAIRSAGLGPQTTRLAVLVGTGLRELRSLELWWVDGQPLQVEELHFGGALRKATGVRGPVLTFSNACSSSNFALGLAGDLLALGEADVVIVGGCDSITESMHGLLDRVNPTPPERVQPFDRDRRGVLLGEGASALVLESAENAAQRNVKPIAWLRGVGMSCDAHHETAPDRAGIRDAMADAHRCAGITPAEVDLLLVHGTGTQLNDQIEAEAILELFGEQADCLTITALKSMLGHTSGASGLMAVVTAIECMNQGCIPPTVGLSTPMPVAERMNINKSFKTVPVRLAQINAFGFGGVNAVAILERAVK
ncbi:MAG: beta-ketoacyl-[acyl-carrier-protein] synthase family protein [Acidiferrobacterales bacterium]